MRALCPRPREAYVGSKGLRVERLAAALPVHFGVPAEDGSLADWVRSWRPALWIHHHHVMRGYRSGSYDLEGARRVAVAPLAPLVCALAEGGARGAVFTGSYFEPGEGGQPADAAVTPYARSKAEAWQTFAELAEQAGLPVSKVVLPNAIGPGEDEARLVPGLVRAAREGEAFELRSPESVSDQLPVTAAAEVYARAAERLIAGEGKTLRPSGRAGSVDDFARTVLRELVEARLGLPACPIETPQPPEAPRCFRNPEAERAPVDWSGFWDLYADWLREPRGTKLLSPASGPACRPPAR